MPDAQPTKEAMEAAQKLYTTIYGMRGTEAGIRWLDCVAAALATYAAERIEDATDGDRTFARLAQVERERDAALARAEAAEADWRMEKGVRDALVERVRVLEASIDLALRFMPQHAAAPIADTTARCSLCGNAGWILDCRTDRTPLSLELIACIHPECTHSGRVVELLSIIGPRFESVAWHPADGFAMSLSRGAKVKEANDAR